MGDWMNEDAKLLSNGIRRRNGHVCGKIMSSIMDMFRMMSPKSPGNIQIGTHEPKNGSDLKQRKEGIKPENWSMKNEKMKGL